MGGGGPLLSRIWRHLAAPPRVFPPGIAHCPAAAQSASLHGCRSIQSPRGALPAHRPGRHLPRRPLPQVHPRLAGPHGQPGRLKHPSCHGEEKPRSCCHPLVPQSQCDRCIAQLFGIVQYELYVHMSTYFNYLYLFFIFIFIFIFYFFSLRWSAETVKEEEE